MTTESRRCSHRKPDGTQCKAWAVRGSDPPACASHARLALGGAPAGNLNAATHGFYSPVLRPDELADLVAYADDMSLDDEIALSRVILRRLAGMLVDPPPATGTAAVALSRAGDLGRRVWITNPLTGIWEGPFLSIDCLGSPGR